MTRRPNNTPSASPSRHVGRDPRLLLRPSRFPRMPLGRPPSRRSAMASRYALRRRPRNPKGRPAAASGVRRHEGDRWQLARECAGSAVAGSTWYRISIVNGKSASSRTACRMSTPRPGSSGRQRISEIHDLRRCRVRTRPTTSATRKACSSRRKVSLAVARVSGGSYTTTCNGKTVSGQRLVPHHDRSRRRVSSRYGVTYVYGAAALFRATTPTSPTPGRRPHRHPHPRRGPEDRSPSIPALLNALVDNSVRHRRRQRDVPCQPVEPDGVGLAVDRRALSTPGHPVTVRAETGGVVFDGGGASSFGGLSFEDGAHDQTWDGFRFANMTAD